MSVETHDYASWSHVHAKRNRLHQPPGSNSHSSWGYVNRYSPSYPNPYEVTLLTILWGDNIGVVITTASLVDLKQPEHSPICFVHSWETRSGDCVWISRSQTHDLFACFHCMSLSPQTLDLWLYKVGIAKNLTGDTYQLRPAVVLTPLLFVYSSLRCPTCANVHNNAHKISLSHSGLILAWKVELVCMSWSPLKKKKKRGRGMNRRFFR